MLMSSMAEKKIKPWILGGFWSAGGRVEGTSRKCKGTPTRHFLHKLPRRLPERRGFQADLPNGRKPCALWVLQPVLPALCDTNIDTSASHVLLVMGSTQQVDRFSDGTLWQNALLACQLNISHSKKQKRELGSIGTSGRNEATTNNTLVWLAYIWLQ